MENGQAPRWAEFGVFEVDLRAAELRRSGIRIRLQEQPFQILCALLERPGELVTREELRQRLWPDDTFVDFDHSINKAINKLRATLSDSAENPRFIETLPRHGYRFIAPVRLHPEESQLPSVLPAGQELGAGTWEVADHAIVARPRALPAHAVSSRMQDVQWRQFRAIGMAAVVLACFSLAVYYEYARHASSSKPVAATRADENKLKSGQRADPLPVEFYAEGMAKMRAFKFPAARDLLEKAVAANPADALAHSSLALAWGSLGYDEKALAEVGKAQELSGRSHLPSRERLLIQGRYEQISGEWPKAVETYRALFTFYPRDVEYGLALALAQVKDGQGEAALETVRALRTLPSPLGDDARIDLMAADAEESLGQYQKVQRDAERVSEKAQGRGEFILMADARALESWACANLDEPSRVLKLSDEAETLSSAAGYEVGVAGALTDAAIGYELEGDLEGAQKRYDMALARFRETGDKDGIAADLNNSGDVLDRMGKPVEAQKRFEETLALYRKMGRKDGIALAKGNLGDTLLMLGNLQDAGKMFAESLALCRESGDESKAAMDLAGLGRVSRAENHLNEARKFAAEALGAYRQIGDLRRAALSELELSEILREGGDDVNAYNWARAAASEFEREKDSGDEAVANADEAYDDLAEGDLGSAEKAVRQAGILLKNSQVERQQIFVALAAARVRAAEGAFRSAAEVENALDPVLREAMASGLVSDQYSIQLTLAEVEMRSGDAERSRTYLEALQRDAAIHGFSLIAYRSNALLKRLSRQ